VSTSSLDSVQWASGQSPYIFDSVSNVNGRF